MSGRQTKPLTVTDSKELRRRVAAKFGKNSGALSFPEHVVLFEVPFEGRDRMGNPITEETHRAFRTRQRFDALAIGIWPSSKGLVHGFELKVSRSDLLHELRDLTKSEHAARNVDRFWLVVGDRSLIKDFDEIPESWGILAAVGRGLRVLRQPLPQAGEFSKSLVRGAVTRALVHPTIGREVRYRDGLLKNDKYWRGVVGDARSREQAAYERGLRDGSGQRVE